MSLKTIKETVGANGANIPADVATVQYLLNCVLISHGGPIKELKVVIQICMRELLADGFFCQQLKDFFGRRINARLQNRY